MKLRQVEVDRNLRESIDYKDVSFPFGVWTDVYSNLVDGTLNCHWHNAFEFGVMLSGELDYYINGTCMKMRKDDCIFINSNTMHMAKQCEGCKDAIMFIIAFEPSLLAGGTNGSVYQKYLQPIIGKVIQGFKIDADTLYGKAIVEMLKKIYALCDDEYGYELQCMALLNQVWYATIKYISEYNNSFIETNANPKHEEKTKDILSYVHKHYTENISINDLAKCVNISRSECFRCFRRFTNKKPVEYINEYRLAHAAIMLKESNLSIAEICTACGFSSSSYFGKLFKEKYAITPLKYRLK